jgi:hypothetical protein
MSRPTTISDEVSGAQTNAEHRRLLVLRWVLVACQAATILISWPLWYTRNDPPLLPALPLPSIDMAVPLLISLALVLRYPLWGAVVHAVLLAASVGMDQTRLQPEVVSMALLLLTTTGYRNLVLVARVHLLTLWFWAGLAKLLSERFYEVRGPWLFEGLPLPEALDGLGTRFAVVVIFLELGAGIFGVPVRTRRIGAALAIAVHLGALVSLGPLGHSWNEVIWPWNIGLAVAAVTLIAPWTLSMRTELARSSWPMRLAVAFLALYPAGYYVGAADTYLSHHLYSDDTPGAVVCDRRRRCGGDLSLEPIDAVRAPLPPEHRLFRAFFDRTCEPGDLLRIRDPRRWYRTRDWESVRPCPSTAD